MAPDGGLQWKQRTKGFSGRDYEIIARPVLDDEDHIYYGSWDGYVYARYPNGGLKWAVDTKLLVWVSGVIIDNDTLYICGEDSNFYAFNTDNGNLKWRYKFGNEIYPFAAAPAVGSR